MQQHIPAWKRIGLKLKYAKDTSHPHYQSTESEINGASTGNHEQNETPKLDDARPPPKKRKLSRDSTARQHPEFARTLESELSKSNDVDIGVATGHVEGGNIERPGWEKRSEEQEFSAEPNTRPHQQSRRKSVTFTPETKQEDGFSSSLFKQSSSNHQSHESEAVSPRSDATPEQSVEKSNLSKTKRSKEKQGTGAPLTEPPVESHPASSQDRPVSTHSEATQSGSQTGQQKVPIDTDGSSKKRSKDKSSESRAVVSSIDYLQQFSRDKSSWRFNKKKQTVLLKNLFDVHLIPVQHNQAIIEYISGLQGQAARQRVIEEATQILQSIAERQEDFDMQSMESEEARRRAYAKALEKDIARCERSKTDPGDYDEQQLIDVKHDVERGQRADSVLFELLNKALHPEQYQQATPASQPPKSTHLNGNNKREASASTSSSRPVESKRRNASRAPRP